MQYHWNNRQHYPHDQVQQLTEQLLPPHTEQQEL
jgi:hypothetical protein